MSQQPPGGPARHLTIDILSRIVSATDRLQRACKARQTQKVQAAQQERRQALQDARKFLQLAVELIVRGAPAHVPGWGSRSAAWQLAVEAFPSARLASRAAGPRCARRVATGPLSLFHQP